MHMGSKPSVRIGVVRVGPNGLGARLQWKAIHAAEGELGMATRSESSRKRTTARGRGTAAGRRRKPLEGANRARRASSASSQKAQRPVRKTNVRTEGPKGIWDLVRPWIPLVVMVLLALAALFCVVKLVSCAGNALRGGSEEPKEEQIVEKDGAPAQEVAAEDGKPAIKLLDEGRVTQSGKGHVTFAAFGDNLANDNILAFADAWGGSGEGDGVYDFAPLYQNVRDEIASYDIAFVNQETTLGGTGGDEREWSGYPSYNTPDSMADALVGAGFRVINTNSNHTYDWWTDAIKYAQKLWNGYGGVLTIGSYEDQRDRDTIRVVECNGVRLAFLSYSYGQNGYEQSDLPNDYYAVPFSEAALKKDVEAAREVADVVVVYLHAGTEYTNEPDEDQVAWAQACANNNVDLVIGSHVHVIQPMRWLDRADGGKMLAVYGMGDFVSGYEDYPDTILSGEFSCEFVVGKKGKVSVEDIVWHPLIEHREGTTDTVYLMRDYTTELAENNELLDELDDPYGWIIETTRGVMGDDFAADVRRAV